MANEQNLRNISEYNNSITAEERTRNARKAGQASGEKRSLKSLTRKWAEAGGYEKMVEVADENLNNPRFWEMLASLLGEAPSQRIEADVTQNVIRVTLDD